MFFSIGYRWMEPPQVRVRQEASPREPEYCVQSRDVCLRVAKHSWKSTGGTSMTVPSSCTSVLSGNAAHDCGMNNFGRGTGEERTTSPVSKPCSWQPYLHWPNWEGTTSFVTQGPCLRRWAPLACQKAPFHSPGNPAFRPGWHFGWAAGGWCWVDQRGSWVPRRGLRGGGVGAACRNDRCLHNCLHCPNSCPCYVLHINTVLWSGAGGNRGGNWPFTGALPSAAAAGYSGASTADCPGWGGVGRRQTTHAAARGAAGGSPSIYHGSVLPHGGHSGEIPHHPGADTVSMPAAWPTPCGHCVPSGPRRCGPTSA